MIDKSRIMELAQVYLDENPDKFLVELVIKPGNLISIHLDGDLGVTVKDCVNLSRQIEGNLDREEEDFALRVSSSGLDLPIKLLRQYRKNIDRGLDIKLVDDTTCQGKLVQVDEDGIEIEKKLSKRQIKDGVEPKVRFCFDEIKESKVVVTFK